MTTVAFTSLVDVEAAIHTCLGCPEQLGSVLERLDQSPLISSILNDYLGSESSATMLKARNVGDGVVVLLRCDRFVLSIHLLKERRPQVVSAGTLEFSVYKSPTPISITRYKLSKPVDYSIFDPAVYLERLPSRPWNGSAVANDPGSYEIPEAVSESWIAELKLGLRPATNHLWHFDRGTLAARFASVGNTEWSGYAVFSRLFASLGERRAIPFISQLVQHPSHIVRWAAIQAIGRLDSELAIQMLEQATTDQHPHIQKAANMALAKLTE